MVAVGRIHHAKPGWGGTMIIIIQRIMKILFLAFSICLATSSFAQTDTGYKKVEFPSGFTAQLNVVYVKVGDWDGRMDLYLPSKDKGPTPIVINIHGGGWNKGVKE